MIEQIRSKHGDNYSYVIYDEEIRQAILIDPVATEQIKQFLSDRNLTPEIVVNTHGHGDHTQGNSVFQIGMGARVLCHPQAKSGVGKVDETVEEGAEISVGAEKLTVIYTPGHTEGDICLRGSDYLLSGDTLFLAGCGNPKFGGDIRKLFVSIKTKLRQLPGHLKLYPGHDYAVRNLEFAQSIEPGNELIQRKIQKVKVARMDGLQPSSILEEEKKYNPFFRFDDRRFIGRLEIHPAGKNLPAEYTDWDVFKHTRELRNSW
ncbi:MAG: hydroxyacylglutathione hydrolase [bacterium]